MPTLNTMLISVAMPVSALSIGTWVKFAMLSGVIAANGAPLVIRSPMMYRIETTTPSMAMLMIISIN